MIKATTTKAARQPPAFQFYASDFLAQMVTLSAAERGLLVSMKAALWVHRRLPLEPALLARYLGLPVEEVTSSLGLNVLRHFRTHQGEIQEITDPELEGQMAELMSRRGAQAAGGRQTGQINRVKSLLSKSGLAAGSGSMRSDDCTPDATHHA